MARFRATILGARGEASRLGTPSSGLTVRANGWNAGIRVEVRAEGEQDVFDVFVTSGSNGSRTGTHIGTLRAGIWEPTTDLADHCVIGEELP